MFEKAFLILFCNTFFDLKKGPIVTPIKEPKFDESL